MDYFVVSLLLLACSASALIGFDLSVATTDDDWNCLVKENAADFGIVRVYRNKGIIDRNSSASILGASAAGLSNIDAYMFPCITESQYSQDNNITCDDAATQVSNTLTYLAGEGIWLKNSTLGPQPYFPVRATVNRMWIDIEDEVPSKWFSANIQDNVDFITSMRSSLESYGIEVGIYTTKTYWKNVMGNKFGFGSLKLWYPHYDENNSMGFASDVLPFAGFDKVYIKQTQGNSATCGLSQIDPDYMVDP